ncbi:DUF3822 family protein [Mucilaginibacter sp. RS28]|uniref:DUF3822 family protein n=1 Tax=Mucilaginibacter straminoryzae TaxID=2932774 RepID=A0A9X2BE63_9SPHI|nr:DUF3822 family protein [Mucilaginibacter straminoryzae]MCJ8211083.1 DUF3822 family protein [Mucilaginibacter straminoryzae]
MANPSKLYFSDHFSIENAKYSTLLLQVRKDDFSFAIIFQNKLNVYGRYYPLQELADPKDLGEFLLQQYQQVIIGLTPDVFTIVPSELYKEDLIANYARFLDVSPHEKVYKEQLDNENLIFYKDADQLTPVLTQRHKYYKIISYHKGWINAIAANEQNWQNLFLDIQHNRVSLVYFKNNKLRFLNGFDFNSREELVYFTALVANELHLSQNNLKLILSGDVTQGDEFHLGLNEFFQRVEISQTALPVELSVEALPQQVLALTSLLKCV